MVPSSDVEMKEHTKNYAEWLKNRLAQGSIDDIATWLAQKPSPTVLTYQAYDINGYMFYTDNAVGLLHRFIPFPYKLNI